MNYYIICAAGMWCNLVLILSLVWALVYYALAVQCKVGQSNQKLFQITEIIFVVLTMSLYLMIINDVQKSSFVGPISMLEIFISSLIMFGVVIHAGAFIMGGGDEDLLIPSSLSNGVMPVIAPAFAAMSPIVLSVLAAL